MAGKEHVTIIVQLTKYTVVMTFFVLTGLYMYNLFITADMVL